MGWSNDGVQTSLLKHFGAIREQLLADRSWQRPAEEDDTGGGGVPPVGVC